MKNRPIITLLLAKASSQSPRGSSSEDARSQICAEVVFSDPAAFFQPVRARSIRTAWIGWLIAWRSFVRQQQLAAMKDHFVSAV